MRILLKVLLLCCCTFTAAQAQGWKGIVPLHSTRADVERLLGPGGDECKCRYDLEGDRVTFAYAKAPCEGNPDGWNVPADTVLTISIYPTEERLFSQLGLDESRYEKDYEDTPTVHYSSREEGVQYSISTYILAGGDFKYVVSHINYVPSSKDARLRCPCFPPDDRSIFRTPPWNEFYDLPYQDTLGRIDNFVIQLLQEPESKGYVIVYAGKQTAPASAKSYVRRYKKHVTEKRGVPAERVSVMYGGYRDFLTVQLYLFRHDIPPPKPRPTYEPCDQEAK